LTVAPAAERRAGRLAVRLTPRGGRDGVDGWDRDAAGRAYLKVRVAAAPTNGEANAALTRLIAKALGRPASAVRIAAGATARVKQLEIEGVDNADIAAAFGVG
jgi:uncharacterized protein YggU (UPF0235/DUF167 family)